MFNRKKFNHKPFNAPLLFSVEVDIGITPKLEGLSNLQFDGTATLINYFKVGASPGVYADNGSSDVVYKMSLTPVTKRRRFARTELGLKFALWSHLTGSLHTEAFIAPRVAVAASEFINTWQDIEVLTPFWQDVFINNIIWRRSK